MKNTIVGVIAIIVAVVMITAPVVGLATLGLISGLLILGMGIWLTILGFGERTSNDLWLFPFLVGIIGVVMGITFLFNTSWIMSLGLWAYIITGILLLITGIIALLVGERKTYKVCWNIWTAIWISFPYRRFLQRGPKYFRIHNRDWAVDIRNSEHSRMKIPRLSGIL
jgi:uncharacterized membrane protein HdeD (DUF308 family)